MNWLKSLWLKVRLPNGRIPQATILIPMNDQVEQVVVKAKRTRKKKVTTDEPIINK